LTLHDNTPPTPNNPTAFQKSSNAKESNYFVLFCNQTPFHDGSWLDPCFGSFDMCLHLQQVLLHKLGQHKGIEQKIRIPIKFDVCPDGDDMSSLQIRNAIGTEVIARIPAAKTSTG